VPFTEKQIDAVLNRAIPVIVQVDYKPDTPALDQHWVVVVGKDEKGYLIADSIDGEIVYLSRYANKPYRMVVYEQVEAEDVLFKVKVICGALNVRSTPVYYSDNRNWVDLLNNGDVVNVYEINTDNGWFRIGNERWISGSVRYTEKIKEPEPPQPPDPTLEERVNALEQEDIKLWNAIEGLE